MSNKDLHHAKKAKNDEFYTQLSDIERELYNYRPLFKGKTILCNCDDPRVSQFFYYFFGRFHTLGLKRLISTCYKSRNPDLFSENRDERAVYCDYDGAGRSDDKWTDYDTFIRQNKWELLEKDGDFRSEECIELLKQADIVATNPPLSEFREYVAQLMAYNKQFIIIGSLNAITYKEIFPLIKENKLWFGYHNFDNSRFRMSPDYDIEKSKYAYEENGVKYGRVSGLRWYTNLDHQRRREEIILYRKYTPEKYPAYDNYDAIEVSKVAEIPMDYDGVMGVPITFLDQYNPDQFEIIWTTDRGGDGQLEYLKKPHTRYDAPVVRGEGKYKRILIKRR